MKELTYDPKECRWLEMCEMDVDLRGRWGAELIHDCDMASKGMWWGSKGEFLQKWGRNEANDLAERVRITVYPARKDAAALAFILRTLSNLSMLFCRISTKWAKMNDRRRTNGPSGGTTAPVYSKCLPKNQDGTLDRPVRTRHSNGLRKMCMCLLSWKFCFTSWCEQF